MVAFAWKAQAPLKGISLDPLPQSKGSGAKALGMSKMDMF